MLGTCGWRRIVVGLAMMVGCSETSPVGVQRDVADSMDETDQFVPDIRFKDQFVPEDLWPDSKNKDQQSDADQQVQPDSTVPPDVLPDMEDVGGS